MANSAGTHECKYCGRKLKPIEVDWPLLDAQNRTEKRIVGYHDCNCRQALAAKREEEQYENQRRAVERRKILESRYEAAKIPKKYREATCDIEPYLEVLRSGKGLYFCGDVGTAKTYTACAVARYLLDRKCSVKFYDVPRIAREARAARSRYDSEQAVLDKICRVDYLILDDLGVEELTDYNTEILRTIVYDREANDRPTIYTSNLNPKDLADELANNNKEILAYRIASRIMGSTKVFKFFGRDRRINT